MYVARDQLCSTTYKSLLIWKITKRSFKLCGWQREEPPRQDNTQLSGVLNTVHLHLKGKGHTFEFASVHILAREDQRCERGVKKAIYVEQGVTMVSLQTSGDDYPRFCLHTLAHVRTQMIN